MTGLKFRYKDDGNSYSKEFALSLDAQDPLRQFRSEFIIPSKKDLKRKTLAVNEGTRSCILRVIFSFPLTCACMYALQMMTQPTQDVFISAETHLVSNPIIPEGISITTYELGPRKA